MSTPQDLQRIAAFRAFVKSRKNAEDTRIALGISPRSWDRMRSSTATKPPAAQLFPRLALIAWREGRHLLAQRLWDAGMTEAFRAECATLGIDPTLNDDAATRLATVFAVRAVAERDRIAALAGGHHA